MTLDGFHPTLAQWFRAAVGAPTRGKIEAWPSITKQLLGRYGVVLRKILEREGALAPWRELMVGCRALEARGEIRGGRFGAKLAGEQFGLPEAVGALLEGRRAGRAGAMISISGADPLNGVGIITAGERVPALASKRILYRDGVPIAVRFGKAVQYLQATQQQGVWEVKNALIQRRIPPELRATLGQSG